MAFFGAILAAFLFSPTSLRAQSMALAEPAPQSAQTQTPDSRSSLNGASQKPVAKVADPEHQETSKKQETQQAEPQQTKRMLWVVPNFGAVSAGVQFTPLTAHQKFVLAFHDSFDYSSFTWTAIEVAQGLAVNSDPEFRHGTAGYGRYYWHDYVDGVSGTYFTEAIVPALTHEDPRYFTLGHGGILRRTEYALTRTLITRDDSGRWGFNWSEVGGNALEATLSNAYYPAGDRGVSQTLQNWGVQMESAALNNIAKEFWPDIRHKILRQKD
jgi:hypothetical protein